MKQKLQGVTTLAHLTLQEMLKDRVLYNCGIAAALLLGIAQLAGGLTYVDAHRVILNFGLTGVTLSSVALGILLGGSMLGKEIERRTLLVALSYPLNRYQFLAGKFLGLSAVLFLNTAILALVLGVLVALAGGPVQGAFWAGIFFIWVMASVAGGLALFFSTLSNTALGVSLAAAAVLVGLNVSQLRGMSEKLAGSWAAVLFQGLAWVLPNFELWALNSQVTYGLSVSGTWMVGTFSYGIGWCAILVVAAGYVLERREV